MARLTEHKIIKPHKLCKLASDLSAQATQPRNAIGSKKRAAFRTFIAGRWRHLANETFCRSLLREFVAV